MVVTDYVALAIVAIVAIVTYHFLVSALIGAVATVLDAYTVPVEPVAVDVGTLASGED